MELTNRINELSISAYYKEISRCIIAASCELYSITEEELCNSPDLEIVNLRFICFWVIESHLKLSRKNICRIFDKSKNAVYYGITKIECVRNIYGSTLDQIKKLLEKANNLRTEFDWNLEYSKN